LDADAEEREQTGIVTGTSGLLAPTLLASSAAALNAVKVLEVAASLPAVAPGTASDRFERLIALGAVQVDRGPFGSTSLGAHRPSPLCNLHWNKRVKIVSFFKRYSPGRCEMGRDRQSRDLPF
jgi:hypothetical protein